MVKDYSKYTMVILILTLLSGVYAMTVDDRDTYIKNPKLESLVSQMISSEDPQLFASTHGLYMENSNIRVIVEISDETAQLPDYLVEETRQGNKIQAMVPIEEITDLSHDPNVIFIRLPSKPLVDTVKPIPPDQTSNPKSGSYSTIFLIFSILLIFFIKKKGDPRLVKK